MARISGVNIPNHQHTEIALTAIYGIGRTSAQKICAAAGVSKSAKVKDLTDGDMDKLREQIAKYTVEGDPLGQPGRFQRSVTDGLAAIGHKDQPSAGILGEHGVAEANCRFQAGRPRVDDDLWCVDLRSRFQQSIEACFGSKGDHGGEIVTLT